MLEFWSIENCYFCVWEKTYSGSNDPYCCVMEARLNGRKIMVTRIGLSLSIRVMLAKMIFYCVDRRNKIGNKIYFSLTK